MTEYLYNAIKAVAGNEFTVAAKITDEAGADIVDGCALVLYLDNDKIIIANGAYYEATKTWQFTIGAEDTKGYNGRYYYCIQRNGENLCFKEPIYLM